MLVRSRQRFTVTIQTLPQQSAAIPPDITPHRRHTSVRLALEQVSECLGLSIDPVRQERIERLSYQIATLSEFVSIELHCQYTLSL